MQINEQYLKYLLVYLGIINIVGFLSMGIDKYKAKKSLWRIPEKTLLLIAFFGGSVGSLLGMKKFRHKTLHPQFKYGIPCFLVLNLICIYFLFTKFILVK